MAPTLCLNMIVKNEAAIIERSLAAAAPYIGCYVICDTGSTDATPDIIRAFFAERGIPGEVVHTTFQNFEQARNEALDAARASSFAFDYLLLCDADMELVVDRPDFADRLTAPVYHLIQRNATMSYQNIRLLRRDLPARYVGVTHEVVDTGPVVPVPLAGAWFFDHAEGSSRAVKYERDIALLTAALRDDPDNPRYLFYLAQSYRDSGQWQPALDTYAHRLALGGWAEEVWYSQLQIATLSEQLGLDEALVVQRYLAAYQARPSRAEPLVALARYYRENGGRHDLAYLFARQAVEIPVGGDLLFVDESAYRWRALDELSVAAYWHGAYAEAAAAARRLLSEGHLPEDHRPRVAANLEFCLAKLGLAA